MKTEADRAAVKHSDLVEDMLSKHSKELEDAGLYHIITFSGVFSISTWRGREFFRHFGDLFLVITL